MCLIKNIIDWCNANDGFAMVSLTAIYAATTYFMFRSSNKMLKLSTQQKEQERVIASLNLIRRLNEILHQEPAHQTDAYTQKEKLSLLQGEISALGGIEAYNAYKKLYDFLNALSKTNDRSAFNNILINEELSKRYLELEEFFRSEAVSKQKIIYKAISRWKRIFKKEEVLNIPLLETVFQYGWGADTSKNGILGVPASKGQCAVTAMIIQDYFKGNIYKIRVNNESHYFNVIENKIIDLTADQFLKEISYKDKVISNRDDFEPETINRYQILKSRVEPFLLNTGVIRRVTNEQ